MATPKIIPTLRALRPREKPYLHSVPGTVGLYLQVKPNGTKEFLYRYTNPLTGSRRKLLLDSDPNLSLADQYDEAVIQTTQHKRTVKAGGDPLAIALEAQQNQIRRQDYGEGMHKGGAKD